MNVLGAQAQKSCMGQGFWMNDGNEVQSEQTSLGLMRGGCGAVCQKSRL
jgi:hypothetical protein